MPGASLREAAERLGLARGRIAALPFVAGDVTAGTEAELQAVVIGRRENVDLPLAIEGSSYLANVRRRAAAGDLPQQALRDLEGFLAGEAGEAAEERSWENSWVRLPLAKLSAFAAQVLGEDLAADKRDPGGARRGDAERFFLRQGGETLLRVPVSYLLKLALADAAGGDPTPGTEARGPRSPRSPLAIAARRLMASFTNDNTSPETSSLSVVSVPAGQRLGLAVAREAAKRFLLTQLLVAYANQKFELGRRGQEAAVFHSPHPPLRQRRLSRAISDAFYRELFISPCLSGWERGEEKRDYMVLCHQALSRSQLHAVAKLREAGVVPRNLVVLPSASDVSLANNGTHVSLGSRRLTALAAEPASGFGAAHEKLLADLVVKIAEHFLPLFVGTYTAAPYRFDFADFHPEVALGFLSHELDFTHLRMVWRRWQGKARNHVLGRSLTPFGPLALDRALARLLGLGGDWVPDGRLIDYPVALLSTETSAALDGTLGNQERLKLDLDSMGVIDGRMSLYLPFRARELARHGYCGFEGRHYSLYESFAGDLAPAVELQALVLAFAYKAIADGRLTHQHVPDSPEAESERRQAFFCAAAGVPTLYVRRATPNHFLSEIVAGCERVRSSRRYPGYLRVPLAELQAALLRLLELEAADLVEACGFEGLLADLKRRLREPRASATGRLLGGILGEAGARSPWDLDAARFNAAAERFYRRTLRDRQLAEACELFAEELAALERRAGSQPWLARELSRLLGVAPVEALLETAREEIGSRQPPLGRLRAWIELVVLTEVTDEDLGARPRPAPEREAACEPTSTWTAQPAAS